MGGEGNSETLVRITLYQWCYLLKRTALTLTAQVRLLTLYFPSKKSCQKPRTRVTGSLFLTPTLQCDVLSLAYIITASPSGRAA
jgi:hypothetical protein